MVDRTHGQFPDADVERIADTYHVWRGDAGSSALSPYADAPGCCKSASLAETAERGFVLTPGRYVGAADTDEEDEPVEDRLRRLVTTLDE